MTSSCPACGESGGRVAFSVREYSFRRCGGCKSLYVSEPPSSGEAQELYADESYFTNPDFGSPETGGYHGYKDYLADRGHIEEKFARVLANLERHLPPGRLLDVGAGPGFMVAAARDRGWDAIGVDLNPWAARHAREELGVEVREQSLAGAGFDDGSFDAVTMMDLVEHVPDPDELLAEAARVTRPGGALALLTPDAGSPVSRLMGARWPEVQRVPEHMVLFSVAGAAALLHRHGFGVVGWHSVGKTSSLATLAADVAPAAPGGTGRALERAVQGLALGERSLHFDPRTKFVIYALREGVGAPHANGAPADRSRLRALRLPRREGRGAEETVAEDLEKLARARRLCDWMFDQFAGFARGGVVEVGAGIGTFSDRMLEAGAERLLLIEPEPSSAEVIEHRYARDERVRVRRELLPEAATLAAEPGEHDFVLCQNVLEHIEDDAGAVDAMAAALRPGGRMTLLVPAHPRLYNSLDRAYGHHRRYSRQRLRRLIEAAGLELDEMHSFNLLGAPGWMLSGARGSTDLGERALAAYDRLVSLWRPLEERLRPPWGLSLVAHARKPA